MPQSLSSYILAHMLLCCAAFGTKFVPDALCVMQWRKAHQPPFKPLYRRPKSIENCNLAMAVMRDRMRLQLVNIGSEDIVNAEGKLIRALLWQLMRCEAYQKLPPCGRVQVDLAFHLLGHRAPSDPCY